MGGLITVLSFCSVVNDDGDGDSKGKGKEIKGHRVEEKRKRPASRLVVYYRYSHLIRVRTSNSLNHS